MTINTSSLGGGGLIRLAPDLTFPTSINRGTLLQQTTGIDASASLTTILNLTGGRWDVKYLRLEELTAESLIVELTVDGVVVWSDTIPTTAATEHLLGATSNGTSVIAESYQCLSSFLLKVKTATDTSIRFTMLARPIL
jgi:hypothetical protein